MKTKHENGKQMAKEDGGGNNRKRIKPLTTSHQLEFYLLSCVEE